MEMVCTLAVLVAQAAVLVGVPRCQRALPFARMSRNHNSGRRMRRISVPHDNSHNRFSQVSTSVRNRSRMYLLVRKVYYSSYNATARERLATSAVQLVVVAYTLVASVAAAVLVVYRPVPAAHTPEAFSIAAASAA